MMGSRSKRLPIIHQLMRAVSAALVLVGVVAGVPVVLTYTSGNPVQAVHDLLNSAYAGRMSLLAVGNVIRVLVWLWWFTVLISLAQAFDEHIAARRRQGREQDSSTVQLSKRTPPAQKLGWLPTWGMNALLTAVLAWQSANPALPLSTIASAPAAVAAAPGHIASLKDSSTSKTFSVEKPPNDNAQTVRVTIGTRQTLWGLAKEFLGDGTRWRDIWALNIGREQADGTVMRSPDLLRPGWTVLVPRSQANESLQKETLFRHYRIADGDNLSSITERFLGQASDTTELQTLNARTVPVADQIRAGAILRLPATVHDRGPEEHAQGSLIAAKTESPSPSPIPGTADQPDNGTMTSGKTALPSRIPSKNDPGVSIPTRPTPGASPTATAAKQTPPTPSASSSTNKTGLAPARTTLPSSQSSIPSHPSSSETPAEQENPNRQPARGVPSRSGRVTPTADGVQFPDGWIPWTLASALAAATALVWLQRRRRHLPGSPDDDPQELPEEVADIHRLAERKRKAKSDDDLSEQAAAVPAARPLPPGGVGLTGKGATAAARGALIAALSAGGPRDPDAQQEVVIDKSTLIELIGPEDAHLEHWPRLHLAENLDGALDLLEERLTHRSRILDENAVEDVRTLRQENPQEEALPPIILISHAPNSEQGRRAQVLLRLGAQLDIKAVFLGTSNARITVELDEDGYSSTGELSGPKAERWALLDSHSTRGILATLREAHTGRHSTVSAAEEQTVPAPTSVSAPDTTENQDMAVAAVDVRGEASPDQPPQQVAIESETSSEGAGTARLNVFGEPRIEDVTAPGNPLRSKARELAVFLACHPDGADTRTIGDHLEPEVRLRYADTRVHTNVSNLRHVLGRAGGPQKIGYVIKNSGRYRLDREHVEVDLWLFQDLISQAVTAPAERRIGLLRRACDLYVGPLAQGCDYDWVEAHRERARQHASEAHLLLAESLMSTDPQGASEVLDRAIRLDRYNEELYRTAMRVRHRLGDHDGIRNLLRALTTAMSDLDAEPDEATLELAKDLRTQFSGISGNDPR